MVADLADRWGVEPYPPSGKTVWVEVEDEPRHPRTALTLPAP